MTIERESKDEYYLHIAEAVLRRSTCLRRKYGAVIVKDDEIISTGYNGAPRGCDNCCDLGYCFRLQENIPHGERYEACLAGETSVKLLDGTYATMRELANMNESVWVYSVDEESGAIVPAIAHNARKTKYVKSLLRVHFDDGGYLDCTPEHKLMMRDLTYKEAGSLVIGDSVMPCNYAFENADHEYIHNTPNMRKESRWILNKVKCSTNRIPTHELVYTFLYGTVPNGYVVHHVDFNPHNNVPSNLVIMSKSEHISLHNKHRIENGLCKFGSPDTCRKGAESQRIMLRNDSDFRRKKSEVGRRNMKQNWANETWREHMRMTQIANGRMIAARYNSNPACILSRRRGIIAMGISNLLFLMRLANEKEKLSPENYEKMRKKYKPHEGKGKKIIPRLKTILNCFPSLEEAIEAGVNYNHKVIRLETITYNNWVYDLTVDGTSNFAVKTSEGKCTIVHNCRSVHAEANAIISAPRRDMIGSTLYLAGIEADGTPIADIAPCSMCQRLILNAGIKHVITRNSIHDKEEQI